MLPTVMLPTVQQELEKLFPNTGGGGRGDKRGDLYWVGAGDSSAYTTTDTNISFETLSITKLTIAEIWG